MYQRATDQFFQIQESLHECSMFVGSAIMKESKVYLVTPIDPMFFMLRALRFGLTHQTGAMTRRYQTLTQILDSCITSSDEHMAFSSSVHLDRLKEIIMESARVKNALMRICSTKQIDVGSKGDFMTYCFEEAKLIEILVQKHRRIIRMLTDNYMRSMTESKAKVANASAGIIKQEKKHPVKKEEAGVSSGVIVGDRSIHEQMFETVAAGMIADELPKDLIPKFLEAIKAAPVFFGQAPQSPGKSG